MKEIPGAGTQANNGEKSLYMEAAGDAVSMAQANSGDYPIMREEIPPFQQDLFPEHRPGDIFMSHPGISA